VTQTANSVLDRKRSSGDTFSSAARLVWIILVLASLYICYFRNLGVVGLVGPDEPRYAWIAREIAESGDWVTPRLYGKPWFEKPALYYWGAAASFRLLGVSEVAARLPSAICALLATLAMAWLGWKFFGAEEARWVLLLLPTAAGMLGFSHAAATDMPFSGMLTVAMVFAAVIVGLTRNADFAIVPRTLWLALAAFGFFLGLAMLAKGPAALILSGGGVLLWAAITKRWSDALRCLHPVAVATFLATGLPWYVLCARRNPDFVRVFLIEHNFKRFLTPEFQHIQPFWYYIPIVLVAFLPWSLALITGIGLGFARIAKSHRFSASTLFLLSWALFCLLFFSLSKSKLPGYILPAVPAIGLLLARAYVQLAGDKAALIRCVQFIGGGLGVLGALVLAAIHAGGARSVGEVLLAIGAANILLGLYDRTSSWRPSPTLFCVVPILLLLSFFGRASRPFLSWDPSGKTLADEIMAAQIPLDKIYVYRMNRGQEYSLDFYLHYEIQEWNREDPKEGYLVLNARRCKEIVQPPLVCGEARAPGSSGWFIYRLSRGD
jgi:4-amino-4-deoxy-L-arabinose transferase-like glycosyltransferase